MKPVLMSLAFLTAAVAGCGGGGDKPPEMASVSGTVNLAGKPVEKGTVTFAFQAYPPSHMDIVGGKFTGKAMIGPNKVSVSVKAKGAPPRGMSKNDLERMRQSGDDPTMVETVPADWGSMSTHQETVAAGENTYTLDIKGR